MKKVTSCQVLAMQGIDSLIPSKNACVVLGVSGGSCSGKTTLVRKLFETLGPEKCSVLYQDNYYIDQSHKFKEDGGSEVNFDHPSSIDFHLMAKHILDLKKGLTVEMPHYDFKTHSRLNDTTKVVPHSVILVDGTLILSQPVVQKVLDASVFLRVNETLRFERRKRRDVEERGRSLEGVQNQFLKQVKPMHDEFVEPSGATASLLLTDQNSLENQLNQTIALLKNLL